MKIESFKHENVLPNGTFSDKSGAVETNGKILMSPPDGGCTIEGCGCSKGHWLTIVKPRTEDGVVEGMTVFFDNFAEMQKSLNPQYSNNESSGRQYAMVWWNELSSLRKTQICDTNPEIVGMVRRWETLTGREIEQLWIACA